MGANLLNGNLAPLFNLISITLLPLLLEARLMLIQYDLSQWANTLRLGLFSRVVGPL
jgi:hypothetical protein